MTATDQEIFSKVVVVKNPHDYDSEEKIFNFKYTSKHAQSPSLGGGFKMKRNTSLGEDSMESMEDFGLHKASTQVHTKYPGISKTSG